MTLVFAACAHVLAADRNSPARFRPPAVHV